MSEFLFLFAGLGRRRINIANKIERTARINPFWVVKKVFACSPIHNASMVLVIISTVNLICEYPLCFLIGVGSLQFLWVVYKEKRVKSGGVNIEK
jgi:hypothetical protein